MAERRTKSPARPRKKRVTFTLVGPDATSVLVTGTFCDWQTQSCALKKDRKGTWKTTMSLLPGRYEYRFLVDGEWRDDPNCGERVPNPFGTENCVLHVQREAAQAALATMGHESTP